VTRDASIVLDTHVWKAYVEGARISTKIVKQIDRARANDTLFISAISVWELATIAAQGRVRLSCPTLQWVSDAVTASGVVVQPLEPAIAVDSAELPLFHGDPADRMIVSTARHLGAWLVTRDSKILDWSQDTKGVRTIEP
jgi:PIN domain nuclease of toxin-antitoxin system